MILRIALFMILLIKSIFSKFDYFYLVKKILFLRGLFISEIVNFFEYKDLNIRFSDYLFPHKNKLVKNGQLKEIEFNFENSF